MLDQDNYSREQFNHFSGKIIEAGFKVHSRLGPGLLEKAYEACLLFELIRLGLNVENQATFPVYYDDTCVDFGYRVDLMVEKYILIELKSVEKITSLHEAQLLIYLKLSGFKLGLLINFNVVRLNDGIKRLVHDF